MKCEWQVEIDPYCQKVLAKHWPHVRRHDDVRTFPPTAADEWRVDVICGGFPCQDISYAGRGAGLAGERSGLFYEAMRVVCRLGPSLVVLENVSALLDRGMGDVLGSMAASGYDAEWFCVQAAWAGAPHLRDRTFILANTTGFRWQEGSDGPRRDGQLTTARKWWVQQSFRDIQWISEPAICRVDDGVPDGVDRLRCLGNAVVPQVAEWIGRRIVEAAGATE